MILHQEFLRTAKRFPRKMAIVDRTTDKRLTYSRTLLAALILARRFRRLPDHHVGIMVPNSAGSFLSVLGVVMAGKVPVMINYSTGAEENARYAQDRIGFRDIITSRALLEKINCPQIPGMTCLEDIMKILGSLEKIRAALKARLPLRLLRRMVGRGRLDDTVVILFTSGSEREPKAVQLTHRNIGANVRDAIHVYDLGSTDTIMSILPLFHVFGHTVDFWMPLTAGMTAVTHANPLDYKKIPAMIREERVTVIAGTPVFFSGYVREAKPGDFDSLNLLVAGADKTPEWLRSEYRTKHGKTLLEGYGTTETSPVISTNTPANNRPGSIGKALPGVAVRIAELETGEPLPAGREGKILVKGELVMKGYYGDFEETSLRIKEGWYDTGDMGMMDEDGYLWHRGRLKRFVKIGGEMVSLVKTESVLEEVLPEGVDCCVVELPDRNKGARLAVAVTADIDEKTTIKKLTERLPTIAVPRTFVRFDELPKMGSGKVDFRTTMNMVRERLSAR
jgi:acyl-[acyl-carrier-protein]-phospholipid O-acyltransferase/long-chain-fatty-acid--[acyl-carrier-protein] ligase